MRAIRTWRALSIYILIVSHSHCLQLTLLLLSILTTALSSSPSESTSSFRISWSISESCCAMVVVLVVRLAEVGELGVDGGVDDDRDCTSASEVTGEDELSVMVASQMN